MPRTRRSSGPSPVAARRGQNTIHPNRALQPGCILWLPKRDDIDERLLADVDIDGGCFNHPVVVLSTNLAAGKATVFILTSFDGRRLAEKYPTNRRLRALHLPIFPSDAHPDNGVLLFLGGDVALRAKSYVKTKSRVVLNAASLIPYSRSGGTFKLKQSSFDVLAAHIPPSTHLNLPVALPPPWGTTQPSVPPIPATPPHGPVVISIAPTYPHIDRTPQRNAHTSLRLYDPLLSRTTTHGPPTIPASRTPLLPSYDPPAATPPPDPGVLADVVALLLLGCVGAVICARDRLSLLGHWALRVLRRKWHDRGGGFGLGAIFAAWRGGFGDGGAGWCGLGGRLWGGGWRRLRDKFLGCEGLG